MSDLVLGKSPSDVPPIGAFQIVLEGSEGSNPQSLGGVISSADLSRMKTDWVAHPKFKCPGRDCRLALGAFALRGRGLGRRPRCERRRQRRRRGALGWRRTGGSGGLGEQRTAMAGKMMVFGGCGLCFSDWNSEKQLE